MEANEKTTSGLSLRDVLNVIFSKKHVTFGVFIVIVGIAAGVSIWYPAIYRTSATVLIKPSAASDLRLKTPAEGVFAPSVTPEVINSEIEIMRSTELLREVVDKITIKRKAKRDNFVVRIQAKVRAWFDSLRQMVGDTPVTAEDKAVAELRSRLKIKPVTMSSMITVTMSGGDPQEISEVVNTFVDAYIDRHIAVYQTKGGAEFFDAQAKFNAQKLQEAEKALVAFQSQWNIVDIPAQRENNLRLLSTLRERLTEVRGQLAEQQSKLLAMRKNPEAAPQMLRDNILLVEYHKSLLPLLVDKYRVSQIFTEKSARSQQADESVRKIREDLRSEQDKILSGSEIDVKSLTALEQQLLDQIRKLEEQSALLTSKETELNRLRRELALNEKNYLLYRDKIEEVRIDKQKEVARVSNVSVVSRAERPSIPVFPRKVQLAWISVVLGLILGVAGAHVAYYLDHTVKMPEDLMRHADMPVLGAVQWFEPGHRGSGA